MSEVPIYKLIVDNGRSKFVKRKNKDKEKLLKEAEIITRNKPEIKCYVLLSHIRDSIT